MAFVAIFGAQARFEVFNVLATGVCSDLVRGIPSFDMVFRKVDEDISASVDRRLARKAEKLRALDEKAFDIYHKIRNKLISRGLNGNTPSSFLPTF